MSDHSHPQLDLDAQLCFPLYAATRAVTRTYATLLEHVGLTYPQYLVMLALWGSAEPVSVGELGRRLHLDSGTLTPLIKRMEAAGLVARRRDVQDERRVLVALTDDGSALRESVSDVPSRLAAEVALSKDESTELRRLLAKVLQQLDP